MQAIKATFCFVGLTLTHPLWGQPFTGREAMTNTWARPTDLTAEIRHEGGLGAASVDRAYVNAGTNRFAFLIPAGFRMELLDHQQIQLFTSDYRCLMALRILPVSATDPGQSTELPSPESILERFPQATVLERFDPTVCGRRGTGLDFEWKASGNLARSTRIVHVRLDAGLVELTLTSAPDQFGTNQSPFNTLMLTLVASDPDGKLVVAPISSLF